MKKLLRTVSLVVLLSTQMLCVIIMAGPFGSSLFNTEITFTDLAAFLLLGVFICMFVLSVVLYLFMDVHTYSLAFPLLLFCMITRHICTSFFPPLSASLHLSANQDMYALFLGLCYLQQASCSYYINQFFHFGMSRWTLRSLSVLLLFLYLLYFFVPTDIYGIYLRKMCPISMFSINFLMFFQLFEKNTAKHKYAFSAAIQYTVLQCNLIIDLLCLGGYTGGIACFISIGTIFLFSLLFLWTYSKQVSSLYEDNRRIVQMQANINEANIKLMLSQIQPHFLYNTLNAICALCYTDPKRAGEAIVQFSKYLKSNMKSLQKTEPADFIEEMLHVQSYIWIEKMRLGDRLNVIYDFHETEFFIPLLTVEPLVENAIRHGISKKISGGTLTIRTYKNAENYYIQIIDDGVGFGDGETSEFHFENSDSVGIKNVSKRLEMLLHGRLDIISKKNIGTTATIILPIDDNAAKPFELMYKTRKGEWIKCVI